MSSKFFTPIQLFSALLLLLACSVGEVRAQFEPIQFTILDAEDITLTDELGHPWDPEDGIWMPSSLTLPERRGLDVFVTNEVCADSVVAWSKSNDAAARQLVSAFVSEYHQRGWLLHRHESSYNLADVNSIAEEIYAQYPEAIDYWNALSNDPRGRYSMALVLHPSEGGPFESIVLSEKVTKYDGDESFCPVYYKNRTVLSNVETIKRRTHFRRDRGKSLSQGSSLTFDENFHIQGSKDQRLVIDRVISTCDFAEDIEVLERDYKPTDPSLSQAVRLLDANARGEAETYQLPPFVFAGDNFQQQLLRRTRGDLLRDTLEHYRRSTPEQMKSLHNWVEFREVEPDTVSFLIPQPLWKLLLRYRSFNHIRERVRAVNPYLPAQVLPDDTTRAYLATTRAGLFKEFQAYVDSGHAMSDRVTVSREADLYEGYISRQNQMNLYPIHSGSRRVRIEHRQTDDTAPKLIPLTRQPIDTMISYRWQMPDVNRYYKLTHTTYLHDFIHADTVSDQDCGCERAMPLQYMNYGTRPATFDCPPRRHIATDRLVTFKPRGRGELMDATYHLTLAFARQSAELNLDMGDNRAQMDSLVQKAYDITHDYYSRIQYVTALGISSPEGGRILNVNLSRARSQALVEMLRQMAHRDLARSSFHLRDSIVPWSDIADIIDRDMPEHHDKAQHIRRSIAGLRPSDFKTQQERIGFSFHHRDPVIEEALQSVREVQVTYSYKTTQEATEEMAIERFRSAKTYDKFPPDYYYYIFTSRHTTQEEKVMVAKVLLQSHASEVRRYCTDLQPTNSFGLVLPMAANILALENLAQGKYEREVLAPFIDRNLYEGNFACYISNDPETPVKFINLDVMLYNQIIILCNIGTPEAMSEAYDLLDILNETATLSPQFRQQYHPEQLEMVLDAHSGRFLYDPSHLEVMRRSGIRNFYVANFADIYRKTDGHIDALQSVEDCGFRLEQCVDSLDVLHDLMSVDPAACYFTAVTRLWQAESLGGVDKDDWADLAIEALVQLFQFEAQPTYISRVQGDSYIRHIYRNPVNRKLRRDIYLEAVERYINYNLNN